MYTEALLTLPSPSCLKKDFLQASFNHIQKEITEDCCAIFATARDYIFRKKALQKCYSGQRVSTARPCAAGVSKISAAASTGLTRVGFQK
jgi:hypothetical protein